MKGLLSMKIGTITNVFKARELLKRGHKVIDVQLKNDRLIFCFEKTDKFFEDLEEIKKL